jgi:hypothetical protein
MTQTTTRRFLLALTALVALWTAPAFAQSRLDTVLSSTSCPGTGCLVLGVTGQGSASFQIVNTGTYTATFEGSVDGINFSPLNVIATNGSSPVTTATSSGLWNGNVGGLTQVRVRLTAYTSGTPHVYIQAAPSGGGASTSSIDLSGSTISGNTAASATGAAVPADADFIGVNNGSGSLVGLTLGQAAKAASLPVTLASNQDALPITDNGGSLTVDGTVTANLGTIAGVATAAKQPALGTAGTASTDVLSVQGVASMTPLQVQSNSANLATAAKQPALGTAGTASTDVLSVQGIASGTALNTSLAAETTKNIGTVRLADTSGNGISSNANGGARAINVVVYDASGNPITAFSGSGGTASNIASAVPSAGTYAGFNGPSGNMQGATVFDLDSGVGAQYGLGVNLRKIASGGSTELIGQAAMAASLPVTIASDQTAVPASQSGTWNITNVSGTVSLPTGAATAAKQPALGTAGSASADVITVQGVASMTALKVDNSAVTQPTNVTQINSSTIGTVIAGVQKVGIADTSGNPILTPTVATNSAGTGFLPVTNMAVFDDASPTSITENQFGNLRMSANRNLYGTIRDAAGNERGANVNASNEMLVALSSVPSHAVTNAGTFAVQAAQSGTWTVQPGNTANTTAWLVGGNKTNNNAAPSTNNLGVLAFLANAASPTFTEGDQVLGSVDLHGSQRVLITASDGTASALATDQTHDAAISTNAGPLVMGYASSTAPTNVSANGDAVAEWHLLNGSLVSNIAAGGTLITSTSTSLNVNCTGGCSGGTQFAEDSAHTSGDSGTMSLGVRQATPTDLSAGATAGDYEPFQVSANGQMFVAPSGYVAHDGAGAAVNPVLVGCYASQAAPSDVSADNDATRTWCLRNGSQVMNLAAGGTLITSTSSSLNVNVTNTTLATVGAAAHDAVAAGAPVLEGAYASAAAPTDVSADGDVTRLWALRSGALAIQPTYGGTLAATGNGTSSGGVVRVAQVSDGTGVLAAVTTVTTLTGGGVASGGADSGNPLKFGGVFNTTQPTVTTGQRVDAQFSARGSQLITAGVEGLTVTANAGTGTFTVAGAKTNNNAAPGATNIGALTVLANAAAPTWTEGDLVTLSSDLAGALRVAGSISCSNCSGSGVSQNDNTAFTAGSSATTPASAFYHSTRDAVTDGRVASLAISSKRGLYTTPETPNGDSLADETLDKLKVSNSTAADLLATVSIASAQTLATVTTVGTVSTVTSLSQLGGVALPIEDAAETAGGVGIYAMAVRRDTAASSSGTDGDNSTINTDASGRVWVNPGVIGIEDAAETAGGNLAMVGSVRRDTIASSAGTTGDNATINTDANGMLWTRDADPCSGKTKSYAVVSMSSATTTRFIAPVASSNAHVCSIVLVASAADNVALIEGTGGTCGTGTAGMSGGTTAATGWNFAANGGFTAGNGASTVFKTAGTNVDVCLITSSTAQLSGTISYVTN